MFSGGDNYEQQWRLWKEFLLDDQMTPTLDDRKSLKVSHSKPRKRSAVFRKMPTLFCKTRFFFKSIFALEYFQNCLRKHPKLAKILKNKVSTTTKNCF